MIRSISVPVPGNPYDVTVGSGAIVAIQHIVGHLRPSQVAIILDSHVGGLHLPALTNALGVKATPIPFQQGETSKSLEMAARCYDRLADIRLDRDGVIVTFGGGVAGDLGGFVAATWLRGVRYVQVPTSLEAAIDASIGGKTAVNHANAKNMIGAFYQPCGVVIDTDFLATLPQREFVAALAESVKHAVIRSPARFDWSERTLEKVADRHEETVGELIAWNCEIKAEVVAADEREAGLRAILNYGHTIAHALEQLLEYELRHGECVALGIIAENQIAVARGLLDPLTAARIAELLTAYGLPNKCPKRLSRDEIIESCRRDKKSSAGAIHIVTIEALGRPLRLKGVSQAEINAALDIIGA